MSRTFPKPRFRSLIIVAFLIWLVGASGNISGVSGRSSGTPSLGLKFVGPEFEVGPTSLGGGFPDGQVTFIREHGNVRLWVPVADMGRTVEFKTEDFLKVQPKTTFDDSAIRPNGRGFGPDYMGGSKVVRLPDGKLVMIIHGEEHPCHGSTVPAIVKIGIATSVDDGASWRRGPAVITGPPISDLGCDSKQFFGAGSFTAAVDSSGTWLYIWFQQWGGAVWGDPLDGLKVARARIEDGLGPGTWWKYFNGTWNQPGINGRATTVIDVPLPWSENDFAGIPTVAWCEEYRTYLIVFTTYTGFWWATSADGVNWSESRQLLRGMSMISPGVTPDTVWYYYPSLIDPKADEDGRAGRNSILYFSKGGPTQSATNWFGRKLKISRLESPTLANTGAGVDPLIVVVIVVFIGVLVLRRTAKNLFSKADP